MADVEKVEPFKEQALTVLKNLIDAATQAGDFIKGQVPLVIRELLLYNTVLYIFWIVVTALVAVASILWVRHCLKKHKSWEDDWVPASIPGWIAAPIAVAGFCFAITGLLQITLAPRVWLIEYATGLVK